MFVALRPFFLNGFFCLQLFNSTSVAIIVAIMSAPSAEAAQAAPLQADNSEHDQPQQDEKTAVTVSPATADAKNTAGATRGFQFWAIMAALCTVGVLGALENTVVTTSLPTIVKHLQIGQDYIWITNIFFLMR